MKVRATLHLRNDAMLAARERLRLTQEQAATAAGISTSAYGDLERMQFHAPLPTLLRAVERVALALDLRPDEVMPPEAAGTRAVVRHVRRIEADVLSLSLGSGDFTRQAALPASHQMEEDDQNSMDRANLRRYVGALPERGQMAIRLLFGLDGEPPYTHAEVAHVLGVSRTYLHKLERTSVARMQRMADAAERARGDR